MIRILIIDDTRIYREGLASTLGGWDMVAGVTTASTRAAARCAAAELGPDVVLINLASAEALETVRQILCSCPATRVVALSAGEDDDEVVACAEAGVAACLWRDGSVEDLERVVSAVLRDEMPCSPRIAAVLRRRVATAATERTGTAYPAEPSARLTPREAEIVRMLEEGCSNKEIARRLNITALTVKNHVHHVLEKLNVRRRGQVAAAARALPQHSRTAALR
ncbi:MAG TPA: response regulator transcription factor [Longimicrobium sp.]